MFGDLPHLANSVVKLIDDLCCADIKGCAFCNAPTCSIAIWPWFVAPYPNQARTLELACMQTGFFGRHGAVLTFGSKELGTRHKFRGAPREVSSAELPCAHKTREFEGVIQRAKTGCLLNPHPSASTLRRAARYWLRQGGRHLAPSTRARWPSACDHGTGTCRRDARIGLRPPSPLYARHNCRAGHGLESGDALAYFLIALDADIPGRSGLMPLPVVPYTSRPSRFQSPEAAGHTGVRRQWGQNH